MDCALGSTVGFLVGLSVGLFVGVIGWNEGKGVGQCATVEGHAVRPGGGCGKVVPTV